MTRRDDHASRDPGSGRRGQRVYFTGDRGVRASLSVVETVAEATGTDPAELRPIYEVVEPDALDRLLDPDRGWSTGGRQGCVTFSYEGCDVAVHADGRTVVLPAGRDER